MASGMYTHGTVNTQ